MLSICDAIHCMFPVKKWAFKLGNNSWKEPWPIFDKTENICTVLFHQPTLMHNFLYSLTICLLHYYPRHVSSINMPIFRRKNCFHTASGIFALCKRLRSILVESRLLTSWVCTFHFYVGISWCYLLCSACFVVPDCCVVLVQFYFGKPVLLILHYVIWCFFFRAS